MKSLLIRLLPLAIIILMVIIYITNLQDYFSLERIRQEERFLKGFVSDHPIFAPAIFIGIYIISVILVIPDSTLLSLLAGFIFSTPLGFCYSLFSETVGAILFYWVIRGVLGDKWLKKQESSLKKVRKEFKRYPASYLLFLRISHISPFWLTNTFAVYFEVEFKTFLWTVIVGTIPLTFILVGAGSSLAKYFASARTVSMGDFFDIHMKIALIGFGLLALLPIAYYKFRRKK